MGSGVSKAVVWQSGVPVDLNALIPANNQWILTQASSVNNMGCIVGTGLYQGKMHGFLLTPTIGRNSGGESSASSVQK